MDEYTHKNEVQSKSAKAAVSQKKNKMPLEDKRDKNYSLQRNNTGLPDILKTGMENLSGKNLDHVQVHYNSPKPSAVQAHAYAQGSNIHIAPGQEKHLPHELGHVVQQMEGRVKPTVMIGGTPVNNNPGLEQEATQMGQRAIQRASLVRSPVSSSPMQAEKLNKNHTAQFHSMEHLGIPGINYTVMSQAGYGQWKDTVQAKSTINGVHHNDDQVVVTQFQNSMEVQQYFLSNRAVGGLVVLEGILSLAAGVAILALSHGVALAPGIAAILVGIAKIVRGAVTIHGNDKPTNKQKALIDSLRLFEAAAGLVGAAMGGNIAGVVFGVAKSLRSVLHFFIDFMDKDNSPIVHKVLSGVAAALHWIEVGAGVASGVVDAKGASHLLGTGNTLAGASKAVTASSSLAVAASKTVRASNQTAGAVKLIRSSPQPSENSALIDDK